jgi:hypothetical protein
VTPEELRLECLKLVQHSAQASGLLLEPSQIISRARAYADFVMDRRDQAAAGSVNGEPDLQVPPERFQNHRPGAAPLQSHTLDGAA